MDDIDQFICEVTTRKAHNVDPKLTAYIKSTLLPILQKHCPNLPEYVVIQGVRNQRVHGRAHWAHNNTTRRMTINDSILRKPLDYQVYVLAHEYAHFANFDEHGRNHDHHGPQFMKHFKRICPKELQAYEIEYKPRNAARAGIVHDTFKDL